MENESCHIEGNENLISVVLRKLNKKGNKLPAIVKELEEQGFGVVEVS